VGADGYTHESVKATAHAFDMSGRHVVYEAASAVAEFSGLSRREVTGLTGRELEQALEPVGS
jgi:hypothetical protein